MKLKQSYQLQSDNANDSTTPKSKTLATEKSKTLGTNSSVVTVYLEKEESTLQHPVKATVVVTALVAAIGGLIFGYDIGGSGGTFVMTAFREQMGWPPLGEDDYRVRTQQALITSLFSVGAITGALPSGLIADKLGRKFALQIAAYIFIFGALLQLTCIEIIQLLVGRFIGGIGVGLMSMQSTLFQSEVAPKHLRGLLVSLQQLCITFGILLAALANVPLEKIEYGWRFSYGMNGFFAAAMAALLAFLPESPRWLLLQDRHEDAEAAMSKLRQPEELESELAVIKDEIEAERALGSSSWSELFKVVPYRLALGVGIQFLQQFTGINVIMFFAPVIFNSFLPPTASLWANLGIQAVGFLGTFGAVAFVDRAGRKFLLSLGGFFQACFCFAIAVMASPLFNYQENSALSFAIVACIAGYVLNFSFGWGPVPWIFCAEIFPLRLRGKAMSVTTFSNWTTNFIIGLVTPYMLAPDAMQIWGTFIFFGSWCVLMTIWINIYLPETKGVALEEMDNVFSAYRARAALRGRK